MKFIPERICIGKGTLSANTGSTSNCNFFTSVGSYSWITTVMSDSAVRNVYPMETFVPFFIMATTWTIASETRGTPQATKSSETTIKLNDILGNVCTHCEIYSIMYIFKLQSFHGASRLVASVQIHCAEIRLEALLAHFQLKRKSQLTRVALPIGMDSTEVDLVLPSFARPIAE